MSAVDDVRAELGSLESKVTAQTTVVDSVVVLIGGLNGQVVTLNQKIADLQVVIDSGADATAALAEVVARGQALEVGIDASTQKLAAQVPVNTPAA